MSSELKTMPAWLRAGVSVTLMVALLLVVVRWLNHASVFPGATMRAQAVQPGPAMRAIEFAAEDGLALKGWLLGGDDAPVKIVQAMGNAETVGHSTSLYEATAEALNAQFLLFDYRGYGENAGTPSEAGLYADIRGAYQHAVQSEGWRPGQIVLWGRSLGCAPATRLAADLMAETRRDCLKAGGLPRAVILEAAFTSLPDMAEIAMPLFGKPEWLCYALFDNLGRAPGLAVPVLQIHSKDDEIVPWAQGAAVHAALPGPKQFLTLEGGGHNNIWGGSRADALRAEIAEFLDRHPEVR